MGIPIKKDQQVKLLFDKLKESKLPLWLHELLGGWLISDGCEDEKDKEVSELFEETFDYTAHPSNEARMSFETFALKTGIKRRRTVVRPLHRRMVFKIAAVLIPAIILTGGAFLLTNRKTDTTEYNSTAIIAVSVTTDEKQLPNSITVPENIAHILPDNSTVKIGAESEIRHAETFDGERRVELRGEAHFSVTEAATANNKFTVHTEHLNITVLGTEFHVYSKAGNDFSTIDLLHGKIEVEAAGQKRLLAPREHLHYNHITHDMTVTSIPIGQLRYDKMEGLVFTNNSLAEIFITIEQLFGVPIRATVDVIDSHSKIRADLTNLRTLDSLMDALSKLSGRFAYEISDNEIIVKKL